MKPLSHIWSLTCTVIALVVAACLVLAAYGGHIDPRTWTLPSMFTLAFPIIATIAAVAAVMFLLLRQWRCVAILAVALAVCWPTSRMLFPMHFSSTPTATDTAGTFRVLTFNVRGFGDEGYSREPSSTMRYILDQNADFVITQETALGPKDFTDTERVKSMKEEINRLYPYHSHGYHDLAILSKHPYKVLEDTTLKQGWMSPDNIHNEYHFYAKAFDIQLPQGRQLRIIGVHLQSIGLSDGDKELYMQITRLDKETRQQMSEVRHSLMSKVASAYRRRAAEADQLRTIIDQGPANVIVCGDFNDTPASYCYNTVRGDDMHDAWQDCAFWPTYTYNANRFYFKIDHMLYRGDLRATDVSSDRAGCSDHYPILATFEWTENNQ